MTEEPREFDFGFMVKTMREVAKTMKSSQQIMLDVFLALFLRETGLKPSQCVLVERREERDNRIITEWKVRRKGDEGNG